MTNLREHGLFLHGDFFRGRLCFTSEVSWWSFGRIIGYLVSIDSYFAYLSLPSLRTSPSPSIIGFSGSNLELPGKAL